MNNILTDRDFIRDLIDSCKDIFPFDAGIFLNDRIFLSNFFVLFSLLEILRSKDLFVEVVLEDIYY